MSDRRLSVHYVIPSLSGTGGAERSLAAMAPLWIDRLDLTIVTLVDRQGLAGQLLDAGVRVEVLPPGGRPQVVRHLGRLLSSERPDLVHTTLWEADVTARIAAAVARIPSSTSLVNTPYGPEMLASPTLRWWKVRGAQAADATTARLSVRFHALTEAVATVMRRRLAIPENRIDVIPRGRSEAALGAWSPERRDAARRNLGVGEGPLVVAAARHEWQKGLDVFVDAAAQVAVHHPDTTFLIGGGDGSQTRSLTAQIAATGLGDRLRLIGERDDLPEVMCAADVFCVPSRWEGFASILAELMCLGVPTVASDIPPIREVTDASPFVRLVRPADADDLATGITEVLDDPTWRDRTSGAAVDRFEQRFRAEVVAERMAEFFEHAVSRSKWERVSTRSTP